MKWLKYCRLVIFSCLLAVLGGCADEDEYRGIMLSGRWFGDLGMMIDGVPAIGADLEFIPRNDFDYRQGYGYETDYYYVGRGRVDVIEHYFTWVVRDRVIYLRFDNPELDCNISDYSLSHDYFEGYMDGMYSSTRFSLRNYELYWDEYGYHGEMHPYSNRQIEDDSLAVYKKVPKCQRSVNIRREDR